MTRKLISLVLVVSMLVCVFTGLTSSKTVTTTITVDGYNITVRETQGTRTTHTTVEGIPMKCERNLSTDEYWLYINEANPIQLEVEHLDDTHIAISEITNTMVSSDTEVAGQFVLTLSFAIPTFIAAAKILICTAAAVTLTSAIYVSANAIGNVIGGVRSNTMTYCRYRCVDLDAATAIRYGKMEKKNSYYEAVLRNNTVYIGREISRWGAVSRLECGYDVFATSAFAASFACAQASTRRGTPTYHQSSGEGYYPHYHPLGRRWVNNRNYAPHCWYPYNN